MNIPDLLKEVLWLILIACGWVLSSIITPYLKKKGENQATKDDIQELTELVQSVEQRFTHETEILKAKLSQSNQVELAILGEERLAVINFQKILSTVYNTYTLNYFKSVDGRNCDELDKFKYRVEENFQEMMKQYSLLLIYLDKGGEIEKLIEDIIGEIISFALPFNNLYLNLRNNNKGKTRDGLSGYSEDILVVDRVGIEAVYEVDILRIHTKIEPLMQKLRILLRKYMYKKLI